MAEQRGPRQFKAAGDQDCCRCCDHPAQEGVPGGSHIFFQPPVQPVAEPQRDFDHPLIAVQLNDIAHTIEHCYAAFATLKMLVHGGPQTWIYIAFKVVGNLSPNLFAVDYHGFTPFAKDNLLLQLPPKPGASRSRSMRRALSK